MSTEPPLNPPASGVSPTKEPASGLGADDAFGYRKILVPVDFSEHTEKTVAHATNLAARFEAKLTLLHVFQTPDYASLPYQGTHLKMDELRSSLSFAGSNKRQSNWRSLRVACAKRGSRWNPCCPRGILLSGSSK